MIFSGKIFVFGDNINTDEIIPARYLTTSSAQTLSRYVMEDVRPGFGLTPNLAGSLLVGGVNFGCGSSREHAPMAIQSAGIQAVIARSFARIFLRNSINIGLPLVEIPDTSQFHEGDWVDVDLSGGTVVSRMGFECSFVPFPDFLQGIFRMGGWLPYTRTLGEANNHALDSRKNGENHHVQIPSRSE